MSDEDQFREDLKNARLEAAAHMLTRLPRFPPNVVRIDMTLHYDDGTRLEIGLAAAGGAATT